jgi:uncharacterized protein (TIGR00106 family)
MLVELSIIPVGEDAHLSDQIAEVLRIIDESDLPYQLTPAGTCIEGDWDEVFALVRKCHEQMRKHASHVFTTLKIEDEAGAKNKIVKNIASVAEKVGKPLARI